MGRGDSDSILFFIILLSSLLTIVSLILEQNLTAGRVWWNYEAIGDEQFMKTIFDLWLRVYLKLFISGFSPSTKLTFLLVAIFIS